MMRKHITLIIMLLLSLGVKAQLVVEPGSFKEVPGFVILDHDKTDVNDVPFAVIKIRTQNIDDMQRRKLTFGGNAAVDTDLQYKVGEVWLYLTYQADYIKISHPDFSSTEFAFPYDMKPNGCYELTLVNNFNPGPKPEADMGGQYFVLTVTPATANVYVDGDLRTTTDGELTIMLPYGEHKYRIEAPSFIGDEGTFTIGKTKVTKTVTLVSAQAHLTLSCGDASAELYLNDKKIGTGSWNGSLDAGMYIVEARRVGHSTVKQSLTLAKQERRSLTLDAPKPIYGKLNLNSTPGNCDVYLDGKKIGTSPDIFSNVLIGTHSIELRKEGYENATKQVTIEENKIAQATVTLTKMATLIIHATPADAEIYVDDSLVGRGQAIVPVPVGSEHHYRVERDNCYTEESTVTLEKSEKQKEINVELETNFVHEPDYGFITIRTEPTGAKIFVDDVLVGETPYVTKKISFGLHAIRLDKKGYESYSEVVFIEKENPSNNQLDGLKLQPDYGFITIRTEPTGAKIFVDDVLVGETPYVTKKISFGLHAIRLDKKGYESYSEVILIEKENPYNNQLDGLKLQKERERWGNLSIASVPSGADISIDGMNYGKTPVGPFELQVGRHTVSFSCFGFEDTEEIVEIKDGETEELMVNLKESPKGIVVVESTPSGAYIEVMGKKYGPTPYRFSLPEGEYDMKISLAEYHDVNQLVKIREGHTDTLRIVLKSRYARSQ